MCHILSDKPFERLNWDNENFNYKNMYRIRIIGDGSCFFHALAESYCKPYREGINGKLKINKREFIRNLRKELSEKLKSKIDPLDKNSPIFYDTLSRGKLREMSKDMPIYKLENMVKELDSNLPVDNKFNEFISNVLEKDIYILDLENKDVYITGDDDDILYKNRDSIVIGNLPGHYELIGIMKDNKIKTLFPYNHPFIEKIRLRMKEKRK